MKISVTRSELFDQLPLDVRHELIGNPAIPEMFTFEVKDIAVDLRGDDGRMVKKFSHIRRVLTNAQWRIFCLLHEEPTGLSILVIGRNIAPKSINVENLVVTHMKGLRASLEKNNLPFEVQTTKGSRYAPGSYKLVERNT